MGLLGPLSESRSDPPATRVTFKFKLNFKLNCQCQCKLTLTVSVTVEPQALAGSNFKFNSNFSVARPAPPQRDGIRIRLGIPAGVVFGNSSDPQCNTSSPGISVTDEDIFTYIRCSASSSPRHQSGGITASGSSCSSSQGDVSRSNTISISCARFSQCRRECFVSWKKCVYRACDPLEQHHRTGRLPRLLQKVQRCTVCL